MTMFEYLMRKHLRKLITKVLNAQLAKGSESVVACKGLFYEHSLYSNPAHYNAAFDLAVIELGLVQTHVKGIWALPGKEGMFNEYW